VLDLISRTPTNVQPVFDAIIDSAVRLCDAVFGVVWRYDGELLHYAASHNFTPDVLDQIFKTYPRRPDRSIAAGRAILDGRIAHVPDMLADPEYGHELALAGNWRASVAVPMLHDGKVVGAISIGKAETGPFSQRQIQLLTTYAAQAVIAIENTRLLNELRQSLEQQTATSEVLGVISSSPGELKLVFDAMLANATQVCEASYGALWGSVRVMASAMSLCTVPCLEATPQSCAAWLTSGPIRKHLWPKWLGPRSRSIPQTLVPRNPISTAIRWQSQRWKSPASEHCCAFRCSRSKS